MCLSMFIAYQTVLTYIISVWIFELESKKAALCFYIEFKSNWELTHTKTSHTLISTIRLIELFMRMSMLLVCGWLDIFLRRTRNSSFESNKIRFKFNKHLFSFFFISIDLDLTINRWWLTLNAYTNSNTYVGAHEP